MATVLPLVDSFRGREGDTDESQYRGVSRGRALDELKQVDLQLTPQPPFTVPVWVPLLFDAPLRGKGLRIITWWRINKLKFVDK